jgi:two-component system, cell cycle sensor histidine kinase and response regulator CckA
MTLSKSKREKAGKELISQVAASREQVAMLEQEKKELQQELEGAQRRERCYEMLVREQGEGIILINPAERFIFANPAAERIFGVEAHGLLGRSLEEFVKPEQYRYLAQQTKKCSKGEQHVYDHLIFRPDGGRRYVTVTATPCYDDRDQFQGTLAIFRDITERKWIEKKDKKQKEILRAIIESSLDGILVVDDQGNVTHTNAAFARMWRIPGELMECRNDKKLLDFVLEQLEEPEQFLAKVRRLYNSAETDFDTLYFKDGRIFQRTSFPLMRAGKIGGRVWNFRDITEEKRIEEEKQELEKHLQHALKMEAIGTLAGGIAHDFNNILSAIIGYSELVEDDLPDDSVAMSNLHQVLKAADRAKELVKQILAFSRKSKEEQQPLHLADLIEETVKLLRASLPAAIDIRISIAPRLNPLRGHRNQIRQVLISLCTNAMFAMREKGGILEIGLKEIEPDEKVVSQQDLEPGRYQQLSVSDTGCGIPAGIVHRIFEPYFTTKNQWEGSGLGLAVVYGVVKSHGGKIAVHSEPGQGTSFHVFFKITGETGNPPEGK